MLRPDPVLISLRGQPIWRKQLKQRNWRKQQNFDDFQWTGSRLGVCGGREKAGTRQWGSLAPRQG